MKIKKIPNRYFDELKNSGNTVPRNEETGIVLKFLVGHKYIIVNETTKESIQAICTQDCPYNLRIINF